MVAERGDADRLRLCSAAQSVRVWCKTQPCRCAAARAASTGAVGGENASVEAEGGGGEAGWGAQGGKAGPEREEVMVAERVGPDRLSALFGSPVGTRLEGDGRLWFARGNEMARPLSRSLN